MAHDCFFNILWFLHFGNNYDPPNHDNPDYVLGKCRGYLTQLTDFVNCKMWQNILPWMKWLCCTKEEYTQFMWLQNDIQNFCEILIPKLIIHTQEQNVTASGISRGRPNPSASQLSRLEVKHSQHWPSKGKQWWCRLCSLQKQTQSTYFCRKCDVGLCIVNCFEKWHTRVNLSR